MQLQQTSDQLRRDRCIDSRLRDATTRRKQELQIAFLCFWAWLAFRCVSDWPRGAAGSGIFVPSWTLQVSYAGLVLWLVVTTPVALTVGRLPALVRRDGIARAHLAFLAWQLVAYAIGIRAFGMEGVVAGAYIIGVNVSFLYVYALGLRLGEFRTRDRAGRLSRRTLWLVSSTVAPTLVFAVVQLATQAGRDVGGIMRVYGGTSSPNVLAAMLLVFISVLAWYDSAAIRLRHRALLGVALLAFVACFSMSGFAALLLTGLTYIVVRAKSAGRIKLSVPWLVVSLFVCCLVVIFAGSVLSMRFGELGAEDNSLTWRLRTWAEYYEVLSQTGVLAFGGGLGFDHLAMEEEPHNEWLRVLTEAGVPGLALFAMTWLVLIRVLLNAGKLGGEGTTRVSAALVAATVGLMAWGMVDSVLRTAPSALLVWAFAGLVIGFARSHVLVGTR